MYRFLVEAESESGINDSPTNKNSFRPDGVLGEADPALIIYSFSSTLKKHISEMREFYSDSKTRQRRYK